MIDYRKRPASSSAPSPVPSGRVDYVHPSRPRPAHLIVPDADGIVRLRAGESITLR